MTSVAAMPISRAASAPRITSIRRRWYPVRRSRLLPRGRAAPLGPAGLAALRLFQRPRLVPPGLDHEVRRRLDADLAGGRRDPCAERPEVHREQVVQAVDPGLDEQLVLVLAEPGEVQHQRLVAPCPDVLQRPADVVREVLAARRGLRHLQQDPGREDALLLEAVEIDGL